MTVPEHDPVYKVTIIPRGRALGVTMFLPEEDRYSYSKRRLESQIASLFGGRIAEELLFGAEAVTTGASNDIERATSLARNMVTKWGLSDRLGPLSYMEDEGEVFLGRSVTQHKQVSDVTAHVIDEEIRRVIDNAYAQARQILVDNRDKLDIDGRGAHQVRDDRRAAARATSWPARAARAQGLGRHRRADERHRHADAGAGHRPAGQPDLSERRSGVAAAVADSRAPPTSRSHAPAMRPAPARPRPARGHGHPERHAGFLLRRRALPSLPEAIARARSAWRRRARRSSTSAASRRARARRRCRSKRNCGA